MNDVTRILSAIEAGDKPSTYKDALARVRKHIPNLTIHCMETTGPKRDWDALTLSPQRLGHGIGAIKDAKLVREIRERGIVLEVCPLSNLLTGVATAQDHPFRRLDEAGVKLTSVGLESIA